jgi:hypothetical protein
MGPSGATGAKGDTGATGPAGQAGSKGEAGAAGARGEKGDPAGIYLGNITVSESSVVAINAGTRRVAITTPAAWGIASGQSLIAVPVAVPSGSYAIHDVIVTGANAVSVGVTAPLLAVGSSYSITCRIFRLNP